MNLIELTFKSTEYFNAWRIGVLEYLIDDITEKTKMYRLSDGFNIDGETKSLKIMFEYEDANEMSKLVGHEISSNIKKTTIPYTKPMKTKLNLENIFDF